MLRVAMKPNHIDDRVHELTKSLICFTEHTALKNLWTIYSVALNEFHEAQMVPIVI